jgi:hypothetical protein
MTKVPDYISYAHGYWKSHNTGNMIYTVRFRGVVEACNSWHCFWGEKEGRLKVIDIPYRSTGFFCCSRHYKTLRIVSLILKLMVG